MNQELTPAQRDCLEVWDKDHCVLAGAGSGKTRMLVSRFVTLVTEKGYKPQDLLAITFTERAAREMKERVIKAFQEQGREKERQEAEAAAISTIHSFCTSVLRRHALEAGLDPAFQVLDELQASRAQEQLLRHLFHRLYQQGDPRVKNIVRAISWPRAEKGYLEGQLLAIYQRMRTYGEPLETGAEFQELPAVLLDLKARLGALLNEIEQSKDGPGLNEPARKVVERALSARKFLTITPSADKAKERLVELAAFKSGINLQRFNKAPELKERLKELRENILASLESAFLEALAQPAKEALVELLKEFDAHYSAWKSSQSLLDFSDLELKTRELLSSNDSVRQEVQRRYRHILVDEFQDTNRLQKGILAKVQGQGNFFAVGDVRQSIYGFRNAEVEVFYKYYQEVSQSGGEVITFKENFRSREPIIEFVNESFSTAFVSELEARSGPLVAGATFTKKDGPFVELILAKGEDANKARELEAETLARRIVELVESGAFSYGDFALLFRATTNIKIYERALAQANLPFYVVSGRGLFNAREVVDLVNLLKVIFNPRDDIALAAVLRSPFVGLKDDTLLAISAPGNGEENRRPVVQALTIAASGEHTLPEERAKVCRFLEQLEDLREGKDRLAVWELMGMALDTTGYLRCVLLDQEGKRKYANLRQVIQFCRELDRKAPLTLNDFLNLARELYLREVREPEALLFTEKDDVVKLMTVHAAKGLEFPVVAVVDLNRGRPSQKSPLLFLPGMGISFCLKDGKEEKKPLSYREIVKLNKKREEAESLRLLYVAMTRAKELLILSASLAKEEQGQWFKHLKASLGLQIEQEGARCRLEKDKLALLYLQEDSATREKPKIGVPYLSPWQQKIMNGEALPLDPSRELALQGEAILARVSRPTPVPQPGNFLATISELITFHRCPRMYYLRYVLGLPEPGFEQAPEQEELQDELNSHELGSLAHRVLASYVYQPGFAGLEAIIQDNLGRVAKRLVGQETTLIANWVRNFYLSPLGQQVAAAETEREVAFVFNLHGLLLRGRVDLLASKDSGAYMLIDFKSDRITEKELEERTELYSLQLQLYSLALEAVRRKLPDGAFLYFLQPQLARPIEVSPEALEAARETVGHFQAAFARREFPARPGNDCPFCPYLKAHACHMGAG